ncbi:NADPH-dependent FMN reductase [Pseudoroseicyclus tamaricis]|uniref:NAD(P)H-dependent oxidoreductase n=1 Tax=Pseudoroseicyclus tamaricis TaxID=2705421 RepID=A0A6B2K4Q7_9RHOB|nr:NADPH-dependent FMN reductase [Pseudoroseicyclus tamaricis]NDV01686.1 NAD(P)H-dependent oxidoreductase [Pseudoroseicyclus tamaricis]
MSKLRIALILSTTRETRFADKPAAWLMDVAAERDDLELEILDLRDFDLPFFEAPASDLWMPASDPKVIAWQEKLAEYDGYVFLTAEYNHSIPGELKNALDQAYMPFVRKPMAAFGYGSIGGARAVEHLRGIVVELQMVPVRSGVNLGASDFFKVHPLGANGPMSDVDGVLRPSATAMLDDLAWWATALKPAREATAAAS